MKKTRSFANCNQKTQKMSLVKGAKESRTRGQSGYTYDMAPPKINGCFELVEGVLSLGK